jgi:hypothetical protein
MAAEEPSMSQALDIQRQACAALGSPMYAELLAGLRADFDAQGVVFDVLADRPRPVRDAVALRLLGALHRMVLNGEEPALAAHYPSVGGQPASGLVAAALEVITRRRPDVVAALDRQVQTNEVGRSAVLASGFSEIARLTGLPLALRELGSSAGLNLRWDRYGYDTGTTTIGDMGGPLVFGPATWDIAPNLHPVEVVDRLGSDIAPLDATDPEAQLTLLSFVWPDMALRVQRLRAALDIASRSPVSIATADAGEWLSEVLPQRPVGAATVVFHSIVWQYLPPESQRHVRHLLEVHGSAAISERPMAWLRMEPNGPLASLRLTLWPGGIDRELASASYHGANITWMTT